MFDEKVKGFYHGGHGGALGEIKSVTNVDLLEALHSIEGETAAE